MTFRVIRMKRNRQYWANRQVQNMWNYMESAEKTADEIGTIYHKAFRHTELQLQDIFDKFRTKHRLSEEEAYKLLCKMQNKTSIDSLKQALRNEAGDKAKAILAELEAPAYASRLNRIEDLQNQMSGIMSQVYEQEQLISMNHYTSLAKESYCKSMFEIQQKVGYGFKFALLDKKQIDKLLKTRWFGKNYSQRIWSNTQKLAESIKQELLVSLLTGRTDRETAEIFMQRFGVSASNARRLVRTESCYISNQMDMQAYEECGIKQYIFIAVLDLRTSTKCQKLDNKIFYVKDQMPGTNCPPCHPWCRSTTICYMSAEARRSMKRRARNPKTGKNEYIPANTNYSDWYKIYAA